MIINSQFLSPGEDYESSSFLLPYLQGKLRCNILIKMLHQCTKVCDLTLTH